MSINKAVITAAGFGSRFLPITKTIPKEMLPIVDKPIIHYIVKECADAGIEEVIIVAAPDEVKIFEDYFYGHGENIRMLMQLQGKMDRWEKVKEIFSLPKITVIPEDRTIPYGNGRPILTAKPLLANESHFVVCFGDDLVLSNVSAVKQMVDFFNENECDGVMQCIDTSKEQVSKGGEVRLREGTHNQVDYVIEKPQVEDIQSTLYSYGRFIIPSIIFDYLNADLVGKDDEVWLQDANAILAKNHRMLVNSVDGQFFTTGDPEAYINAFNAFWSKHKNAS